MLTLFSVSAFIVTVSTRTVPECFPKLDLVFILDSSTSVGRDNFDKLQQFCKNILLYADINSGDVRVGIASYSTVVTVEFQLKDYSTKEEIYDAIDRIPWRYGGTNTADALRTLHETMFTIKNGDRPDVSNIAIVITDGVSSINARRTVPEAYVAKDKDIHIYSVGIGLKDKREVKSIASVPAKDNAFFAKTFDDLEGLVKKFSQPICKRKNEQFSQ